jgi:hypothetical protein
LPKRWPTRPSSAAAVALALLAAMSSASAACSTRSRSATTTVPTSTSAVVSTATTTTGAAEPVATLVAAGDIACPVGRRPSAGECQQEATAALAESLHPDVVLPLGDLQYDRGEASGFAGAYGPTWGRMKAVTHPVPGNHEYAGGKASGYFSYWGEAAHGPRGWYSFDVAGVGWHVVVVNSVCDAVGGCGEGSAQLRWLRDDLRANASARCTLAAWHHPRFSSGLHGSTAAMQPVWQALADAGADVVLSGHDHHYERFAPEGGVRELVVGTGGRNHYPVVTRERGSEALVTGRFGVLAMTLRRGAYDWRFLAAPGGAVLDSGQASCR